MTWLNVLQKRSDMVFLLHFVFKPKKEVCHISELDHKNLSWTFDQGAYGTSDFITFFHSTFS